MDEILDILIEWIFGHRRGLLKQVDADDKAIERFQTLKEQLKEEEKPEPGSIYELLQHPIINEYIKTGKLPADAKPVTIEEAD